MVRRTFLGRIDKALAASDHFDATDFDITVKDAQSEVEIKYRFDPQYRFEIDLAPTTVKGVTARESPGETDDEDYINYDDADTLLMALTEWTDRLYEELSAIPIYRMVEDQRRQLDEFFAQYGHLEDEYFTRSESDELNLRLSNLEEQLIESIRANALSEAQAGRKIAQLDKELTILREKIDILKKPAWASSLVARVWEWSKDPSNQKVLASGVNTAAAAAKVVLEAVGDNTPQLPPPPAQVE